MNDRLSKALDKFAHGDYPQRHDPKKRVLGTAPPLDRRESCLATIGIELQAGNQAACIAAVKRAFSPVDDTITLDSHIGELGLPLRIVNALTDAGIHTVGQLGDTRPDVLLALPMFAAKTVQEICEAMRRAFQEGSNDDLAEK